MIIRQSIPADRAREPATLVLCADDYGLTAGVSRAILELLQQGRLSATSCMTTMPAWADAAPALAGVAGRVDLGLHLTLTDHRPLGQMPALAPQGQLPRLPRLAALALARRLDRDEIAAEIDRQLDAFVDAVGAPPDYVDGHQHVHLFPIVREAVLAAMARRLPHAYVRQCHEPAAWILRRRIDIPRALALAGLARPLRRAARARGVPANDSFRGVNAFRRDEDFRTLFRGWLRGGAARPLVMCHPGYSDSALAALDTVTDRREDELRYLSGPEFPTDLAGAGWRLNRFPGLTATAGAAPLPPPR